MPTVVHIVDDNASFRVSLGRLLRASGYEVAMYESASQLLEKVPRETGPACILLDVQMPGLSGLELQSRLAAGRCALPIVFLTGHADTPTTVQAIKSGAEDVLTKPVPRTVLIDAIERAVVGARGTREQYDRLNAMRELIDTLTPRERQVFERVVRGAMNKQIARELGTTERTIKAHRQKVMEKARVQSLAELVSLAERLGILAAPTSTGATRTTDLK